MNRMSDLISRQAAIDKINARCSVYSGTWGKGLSMAVDIMRGMPSAEPERKIELHGDESAIEILSELRSWFSCFDEKEGLAYHALSLAIRAIQRYDLFDNFLETRGCETGRTGKIQYGVSSAPCNWVYPYLKVLSEDKRFSGFVYEIEEQMGGEQDE